MTTATTAFRPFHAWDRNFFLAFVAICWLGVIMGFAPAVSGRLQGQADYPAPLFLHIHAAAFVGWLVLLTSQATLIRVGRVSTHQAMGRIGVALVPVMVVTALVSEVYSQRFYADRDPENLKFFIIPLYYVVAFGVLASAALLKRRDPPAHKRLILLATAVIVGAAYARWWGESLAAVAGDGFWGKIVETYTAANLIILLALAYDAATRRRLHPVYLVAVPALIAAELAVSFVYHLPGWPVLARRLIGL
jgi:hypothetical protein